MPITTSAEAMASACMVSLGLDVVSTDQQHGAVIVQKIVAGHDLVLSVTIPVVHQWEVSGGPCGSTSKVPVSP